MSHPDPSYDPENSYPLDEYSAGPSDKKGEMARKMFDHFGKSMAFINKSIRKSAKKKPSKYDVGRGKGGRDEYDSRLDEHNPFMK